MQIAVSFFFLKCGFFSVSIVGVGSQANLVSLCLFSMYVRISPSATLGTAYFWTHCLSLFLFSLSLFLPLSLFIYLSPLFSLSRNVFSISLLALVKGILWCSDFTNQKLVAFFLYRHPFFSLSLLSASIFQSRQVTQSLLGRTFKDLAP